jgi:cytoplasmic iron level regulating protein YaaA (DUF328/UPF0246 family)
MKIVISPAKSLNWEVDYPENIPLTQPRFLDEAVKVNAALKRYSVNKLTKLQGISKNLAELNHARNQNWQAETDEVYGKPAAFAFDGDVYRGLDIHSWAGNASENLENRLRIMSGLYGILSPFDLIRPYRLEMGTSLKIRRANNLYQFWRKKITPSLKAEMEEGETLINLASNEYFKAIDTKELKRPVTSIEFKDRGPKGEFKVLSFYAKKARGLMARYINENNISDLNGVMNFEEDGYFYDAENSSEEKMVFLNERNNK